MPDRITTVFEYSMGKEEIDMLVDGVVKLTRTYLDDTKYDVLVETAFHTTHHRYCFSSDYLIYINRVLVFQKCDKHFDDAVLRKNISKVKKMMETKTYEDKEPTGLNDVDYLHCEWSIVGGLPVIIECKYENTTLSVIVFSQEDGNVVCELEEEYDTECEAVEYAVEMEQRLYNHYHYNGKRQMLVHYDEDDEDEDDEEDEE